MDIGNCNVGLSMTYSMYLYGPFHYPLDGQFGSLVNYWRMVANVGICFN